jgi:hypothetical protein
MTPWQLVLLMIDISCHPPGGNFSFLLDSSIVVYLLDNSSVGITNSPWAQMHLEVNRCALYFLQLQ